MNAVIEDITGAVLIEVTFLLKAYVLSLVVRHLLIKPHSWFYVKFDLIRDGIMTLWNYMVNLDRDLYECDILVVEAGCRLLGGDSLFNDTISLFN